MSGFSFDTNILIDALAGLELAQAEIRRAVDLGARPWISRMVWIEILSKGTVERLTRAQLFLSGFGVDEIDLETATRAAALRRQRAGLKSPDAIILATAQIRGRVLVTRNVKDFPATMPGIRVPYTL